MSKLYQLLLPEQFESLWVNSNNHQFTVIFLHWLIDEIHQELGDILSDVDVEVIRCTPHQPMHSFPTLGIHYYNPDETPDLLPIVEQKIDKLMQENSIAKLITFVGGSKTNWGEVTERILQEGR